MVIFVIMIAIVVFGGLLALTCIACMFLFAVFKGIYLGFKGLIKNS